jgi:hypothetical protein
MTSSTVITGASMFALGLALGWAYLGDTNRAPIYGPTGAPKNCRALIAENLQGYRRLRYTAEEALASIDRNCGPNGYSWGR